MEKTFIKTVYGYTAVNFTSLNVIEGVDYPIALEDFKFDMEPPKFPGSLAPETKLMEYEEQLEIFEEAYETAYNATAVKTWNIIATCESGDEALISRHKNKKAADNSLRELMDKLASYGYKII